VRVRVALALWLLATSSDALADEAGVVDAAPVVDSGSPRDASARDADRRDAGAPPDTRRPLPEWAPKLSATVKPAIAVIGDPIVVTITVRHRRGVSVNLPLQLELGKFNELSREDHSRELGAKSKGQITDLERVFVVKIAAYELGELTLPPLEVTALGPGGELVSLTTEAMPIRVQGVLRNEPNPKPKGLEPPVSVWQRSWLVLYLMIALAAAGVIVVVTLLVSRHLRARREALRPPPPPIPAHVIALRRLEEIDVEAYIAAQRFKELYLLLSEILRQYVGSRWSFDGLEMTTTEIRETMAERLVSADLCGRFEAYFLDCDLVKFAKYQPEPPHARQAVNDALALVRSTADLTPIAAPAAPAPAPGVAAPAGAAPTATSTSAQERVATSAPAATSSATGTSSSEAGRPEGGDDAR
jgi:hypothetical protein